MATDNDKNFDAMMSTLFECADMNTEDLEEFAENYLARLRAADEFAKTVKSWSDSPMHVCELGQRVRQHFNAKDPNDVG